MKKNTVIINDKVLKRAVSYSYILDIFVRLMKKYKSVPINKIQDELYVVTGIEEVYIIFEQWRYNDIFKKIFKIENKNIRWTDEYMEGPYFSHYKEYSKMRKISHFLWFDYYEIIKENSENYNNLELREAIFLIMKNRNSIDIKQLKILASKMCDRPINSIHSSLFSPSKYLSCQSIYGDSFIIENNTMRWRMDGEVQKPIIDYNTEEKNEIRGWIFDSLRNKIAPRIAINSHLGYDVLKAREINENVIIYNIEWDKKTLSNYKLKGYNTKDYNMDVVDFFPIIF